MPNSVSQQTATRNQSTARYTFEQIFIGYNKFDRRTLTNEAASDSITLGVGQLLYKSGATKVDVLGAAANIDNVCRYSCYRW